MFSFYNPVQLKWGLNIIENIDEILEKSSLNMNSTLILTGKKSLKESGKLDLILKSLEDKEVLVYNDISSNPEISDLYNIKLKTDKFSYDSILAIGGGSVIDIAKCLVAFKNTHINTHINTYSQLEESIINKKYQASNIGIPIIALPTTAGTGSEVTSWATIWDKDNNKKYSVEDERLYPRISIIDPILTINLPLKLTVSTALDALSHALEAYWSRKSNEIVRMYALESIRLIIGSLDSLIDNLDDLNLRSQIAKGSLYAGLAFSNTKTTACHSISYPLTSKFNIPHGVATSITLASFLEINQPSLVEKDQLLKAFGVDAVSQVRSIIDNIYLKSKIPFKLKDYGIKEEEIDFIVAHSFTPDRMNNNPVEITREVLKKVLQNVY